MTTEGTIISISLIALFLVLSAFFSSSETAFMSLERVRILHFVNVRRHGAEKMLERLDAPERTLSTVLLGNNLVNIAAASVGTALAVSWLGENTGVIVANRRLDLPPPHIQRGHPQDLRQPSLRMARIHLPQALRPG